MNTNLIYVPLRGTEAVDLVSELGDVIDREFFQSPVNFREDLCKIDQLRKGVAGLKDGAAAEVREAIGTIKLYYRELETLATKFADESLEFAWFNTLGYGRSSPKTFRSIRGEQMNVLFLLGCAYSQAALGESRHTDDGLKQSCILLQKAAGFFAGVESFADTVELRQLNYIGVIPSEFMGDTLGFLKYLMLAQAQETIWQKTLAKTDFSDSVIAKLAMQTSDYYCEAVKFGNESRHIKLEWLNHCSVKQFHFKAAAYYRTSEIRLKNFDYGQQVALMRIAWSSCNDAKKKTKYVSSIVKEDLIGLSAIIEATLKSAEKDNDFIYLKPVPSEKDVAPIQRVSLVKILDYEESIESATTTSESLKGLIPYSVIQAAQAFRERQIAFVEDSLRKPTEALNKQVYLFLNERGLPSSIDALQKPENLPESIVKHSQEIRSLGGLSFFKNSLDELYKLANQSKLVAQSCKEKLQLEEDEDEFLRNVQGTQRWTRPPSKEAAASLLTKISSMDDYLQQSEKGDELIKAKYTEILPYIKIYSEGYEKLIQSVPNSAFVHPSETLASLALNLREHVNGLDSLVTERKTLLENAEVKANNNSILSKLMDYVKLEPRFLDKDISKALISLENVYEQHLSQFNSDLKQIEDSKRKQQDFKANIDSLKKEFQSELDKQDMKPNNRQETLQLLENVYLSFLEWKTNVSEGITFYQTFIERANKVLEDCTNFVSQRRLEGRELQSSINQAIGH